MKLICYTNFKKEIKIAKKQIKQKFFLTKLL
jgi:hypothetical protein